MATVACAWTFRASRADERDAWIAGLVVEASDPSGDDGDVARALGAVIGLGRPAAPAVEAVAADPSAELPVRLAAVRLLARIGGPEGVGALAVLSREASDVEVRWAAVEGLATFDDDYAIPALIPLVWDPTLAPHALWALSTRRNPALVPVLRSALDDATTRPLAIEGLGSVCSPAAVQTLLELAGNAPPPAGERALTGLLRCGGEQVVAEALGLLEARSPLLRATICRELVTMGADAVTLVRVIEWASARGQGSLGGAEMPVALALARMDPGGARATLEGVGWTADIVRLALSSTPQGNAGKAADAVQLLRSTAPPDARDAARAVVDGPEGGPWEVALDILGDARTAEDVACLTRCLAGPRPRADACLRALVLPSRTLPEARLALESALDGAVPVTEGLDLRTAAWRSGVPGLVERVRGEGLGGHPDAAALGATARRPVGPREAADRRDALRGSDGPAALDAIVDSGDADAVGAVEAWARRAVGERRGQAVRALGRLRAPRAMAWLDDLAGRPSEPARLDAIAALARLDAPGGGCAVARALDLARPELFLAAAAGLEANPCAAAHGALLRALDQQDGRVAVAAARALAAMGDRATAAAALVGRTDSLSREVLAAAQPVLDGGATEVGPAAPPPTRAGPLDRLDLVITAAREARAPVAAHLRAIVVAVTRGGLAEALAEALTSWEPDVRAAAAPLALGEDDPRIARELLRLTRGAPPNDELWAVRAALTARLRESTAAPSGTGRAGPAPPPPW